MHPVKLGIIGCGIAASELHWPALKDMTDTVGITAVCNHTEPKAKSFAELAGGVPYVLDYQELLDRDDVEAVSIILPFELNRSVTMDVLNAGKHVMVEKPLAGNLDDARKMLGFEEQYPKLVMMVAENYRYRPLFLRVREILDEGAIGGPYAAVWNFFTDVGSGANVQYLSTRWRIEHTYRGGFLTDGGVHIIAVLRDLFGGFSSVTATTGCVNPGAGKVDTMSARFTMAGGFICSLNQFYSSRGLRVNAFHIFGDAGTLVVDVYGNTITLKKEGADDHVETPDPERGYAGEYRDFHRAIRTGSPAASTFREAFYDLQGILGALESAELGKEIQLKQN